MTETNNNKRRHQDEHKQCDKKQKIEEDCTWYTTPTRQEMISIRDIRESLSLLQNTTIRMPNTGKWQRTNEDPLVPNCAYLSVVLDKNVQPWSFYMHQDSDTKVNTSYNPLVYECRFGTSLKHVLQTWTHHQDESQLVVFKVPLSLFGNDLGMLYDATQPGTWLEGDPRPAYLTQIQHQDKEVRQQLDKISTKLDLFIVVLKNYLKDSNRYKPTFRDFLWQNRYFLNRYTEVHNHHVLRPSRELRIPVAKVDGLLTNPDVPRVLIAGTEREFLVDHIFD